MIKINIIEIRGNNKKLNTIIVKLRFYKQINIDDKTLLI